MKRILVVNLAAAALAGCAPMHAPVPFQFAETADVLDRGSVAATAALGAGKMNYGKASGGALRGRIGLGAGQEIGVGVMGGSVRNDDPVTAAQPWKGTTSFVSGKVDWKMSVLPWLAVIVGGGGSHAKTGNALGGDAGLLFSAPQPLGSHWRPYLGGRYAYASPLEDPRYEGGGPLSGSIIALGTGFDLNPRSRLFLEFGNLHSVARGYVSTDV